VNVTNVGHIQAGIDFARSREIRLVIKNTGHDFSGKNLGGGALSIWTHVSNVEISDNSVTHQFKAPERYHIL
jgi:hypothetical protein